MYLGNSPVAGSHSLSASSSVYVMQDPPEVSNVIDFDEAKMTNSAIFFQMLFVNAVQGLAIE